MRQGTLLTLLLLAIGCGDSQKEAPTKADTPGAEAPQDDGHGAPVDLGTVRLLGQELAVTVFGEVVPGEEAAFGVSGGPEERGDWKVYLWLQDEDGKDLCAPAKGSAESSGWHFHVAARQGAGEPFRVVVRVRAGQGDERKTLPLSGHGHEHPNSPHHGIVAVFSGPDGKAAGHLELKLHDDKGDLELWLARDKDISEPVDLPLDAKITVTFIDHDNRKVTLAVRNKEGNEDEDGTPNVRDKKTNYFIFPGDSGQDPSWLQGKTFSSIVQVAFELGGRKCKSEEFMLVPHLH